MRGAIEIDTGFLYTSRIPTRAAFCGVQVLMNADDTASQFVNARLQARPLTAFPGILAPDLAAAYDCQLRAIARWPDRIAGWKVARIGATWHSRYAEERLIGPVFARNVHPFTGIPVDCPVFDGGLAAVEAEIGIVVSADAAPGKTDWNAGSATELVGQVCIGVEIASSPLATLNDLGPGAVVSDFGNNWGVILGAPLNDWRSASALPVETYIDGALVGSAPVVPGGAPLEALAFAANKAALLGLPLRGGAYISTGMITGVHDIRVGQRARLVFADRGEILCRITAARPIAAAVGAP